MLRRVVWYILTDVSEKLTAFIIISLIMVEVNSSETSVGIYHRLHSAASQKPAMLIILVAVKT
jgi:hypothetical protein